MPEQWAIRKMATIGAIVGLLISVILVTALASTVVRESENVRALAASDRAPEDGSVQHSADNEPYSTSAAGIFAMFPLFWAIVGIAIIAGGVLVYTKGL